LEKYLATNRSAQTSSTKIAGITPEFSPVAPRWRIAVIDADTSDATGAAR